MKLILKQEEFEEFKDMGKNGKSIFEALTDIMELSIMNETIEMSEEIEIHVKPIEG